MPYTGHSYRIPMDTIRSPVTRNGDYCVFLHCGGPEVIWVFYDFLKEKSFALHLL